MVKNASVHPMKKTLLAIFAFALFAAPSRPRAGRQGVDRRGRRGPWRGQPANGPVLGLGIRLRVRPVPYNGDAAPGRDSTCRALR